MIPATILGNAELYQGEACAIIQQLAGRDVDAIFTDPPYSSGGMMRGDRIQDVHTKYVNSDSESGHALKAFSGDTRDQFGYWFWVSVWMSGLQGLLKPGGLVGLFTDWRQLPVTVAALQSGGFVWRGIVNWHKPSARPVQGRFTNACEYMVWGTNGPRELAGSVYPGLVSVNAPRGEDRDHITQKPVELLEAICKIVPDGGLVMDPFMGSGTTGVACMNLGLKFIGVELDRHSFDAAATRIENAQRQARMFA